MSILALTPKSKTKRQPRRKFLQLAGAVSAASLVALIPHSDEGDPDEENVVPAGLARYASERQSNLSAGDLAEAQGKAIVHLMHGPEAEGWKLRTYCYRSGRCVIEMVDPSGKVAYKVEGNLPSKNRIQDGGENVRS